MKHGRWSGGGTLAMFRGEDIGVHVKLRASARYTHTHGNVNLAHGSL